MYFLGKYIFRGWYFYLETVLTGNWSPVNLALYSLSLYT